MLKFVLLAESERKCDECGRKWFEVCTGCDGPDVRQYAEVRGCIGLVQFVATLCPACLDELGAVFFDAADHGHIYRSNKEYERERLIDALLSRLPIPFDPTVETEAEKSVIRYFRPKGVA